MRAYQIAPIVIAVALAAPAIASAATVSVEQTGIGAGPFALSLSHLPAADPDRGPVVGVSWTFTLSATVDGTVQNFFSSGNNLLRSLDVGVEATNLTGAPATLTATEVTASGRALTNVTLAQNETESFSSILAVFSQSGTVSESDLVNWLGNGQTTLSGDIGVFQTIRNDGGAFAVIDSETEWTARLEATYAYIPVPAAGVLLGSGLALILGMGFLRRRQA